MTTVPQFGQSRGFSAVCEFCYILTPTNTMWEVPYDDGTDDWFAMCAECHKVLFGDDE